MLCQVLRVLCILLLCCFINELVVVRCRYLCCHFKSRWINSLLPLFYKLHYYGGGEIYNAACIYYHSLLTVVLSGTSCHYEFCLTVTWVPTALLHPHHLMIQSHSLYHCKCLEYIGILNGMGKLNIFSRVWIEKRSKGKGLWCCNVVPCKAECVVHLWLQYLLCYRSGQFQLKLADILSLKESNSQYSIFRSLRTITNATTHNDVAQQLGTLTAYSQMCYLASDHKTLSTITWNTYFSRYGMFSSLTSTLSYSFV